ncbi:MAG: YqgE/AlgH family protein [Deltaproteobacteria bacterium]|nr:YqgE/AlgH family protein [Deltaproteobacteria bacterium]
MRRFRPRWKTLSPLLFAAVLVAAACLYAAASIPPPDEPFSRSRQALAKGRFLVASENMRDPKFSGSVILLTEYGWQGAAGVIVNRPTNITLAGALPGVKGLERIKDTVWFGGPVGTDRMTMLVKAPLPPPASGRIFSDIYASASMETLEAVLAGKGVAHEFRMYVGFAGWAPQQLEAEVAQGGWYVLAASPADVFSEDPSGVWPRLMHRVGH